MIPPKEIIVDEKKNPRADYGEIEELMNSIIENGIRNPLKGFMKDGKIHLREDFRRMRAVVSYFFFLGSLKPICFRGFWFSFFSKSSSKY